MTDSAEKELVERSAKASELSQRISYRLYWIQRTVGEDAKERNKKIYIDDVNALFKLKLGNVYVPPSCPDELVDAYLALRTEHAASTAHRWIAVESKVAMDKAGITLEVPKSSFSAFSPDEIMSYIHSLTKISSNLRRKFSVGCTYSYSYSATLGNEYGSRTLRITNGVAEIHVNGRVRRSIGADVRPGASRKSSVPRATTRPIFALTNGELMRMVRDGRDVDEVWREAKRRGWSRYDMARVFDNVGASE